MATEQADIAVQMADRFKSLPQVVQQAITSANVQRHLRELADTHKLHLDQWQLLENEVMLTLLGFERVEQLENNIQHEVNVPAEEAHELAASISATVFEPIRGELERALEHPEAEAAKVSDVESMRSEILADSVEGTPTEAQKPSTEPVAAPATPASASPATPVAPPIPVPIVPKVERAPASSSYAAQVPSVTRKSIEGDPYREQVA